MTKPPEKTNNRPNKYAGLGLIFGAAIGAALDNVAVGIAIGLVIGAIIDNNNRRRDDHSDS